MKCLIGMLVLDYLMRVRVSLAGDIDGVDDGPDDESEVPTLAPSDPNFLDNHGEYRII